MIPIGGAGDITELRDVSEAPARSSGSTSPVAGESGDCEGPVADHPFPVTGGVAGVAQIHLFHAQAPGPRHRQQAPQPRRAAGIMVADRLGVEVAWETPKWEVLTAGSWNDRWDMSVGSMTPTNDRQEVLEFTEPYSFVPAVVVVPDDSSVTDVATDLDGKKIGVCADCTYQFFLEKNLAISGFEFDFVIDDATVQGYDTDTTALQDLALGRLDAVMTSVTTAQAFIDGGNPVKIAGDPLFGEPLAVAFDKDTDLDNTSLVEAVDQIVKARQQRQQILERQHPPKIIVILDEGVLLRRFRDARVMVEQIDHLLELSHRPRLDIQIVPIETEGHAGLGGSFTLLEAPGNGTFAYVESQQTGMALKQPEVVASYERTFAELRSAALPVTVSRSKMEKIRGSIT